MFTVCRYFSVFFFYASADIEIILIEYAYSSALTDIVEDLEQLQRFTKMITGEMALDFPDW